MKGRTMLKAVIMARDEDGGIGFEGRLPWPRLRADLAWFKARTMGHAVIMGRATWEGLPLSVRPLSGRLNIVLSSTLDNIPGVLIARSLSEAYELASARGVSIAFVIGGEGPFHEAIGHADVLFLTRVHGHFKADRRCRIGSGWITIYTQQSAPGAPVPFTHIISTRRKS